MLPCPSIFFQLNRAFLLKTSVIPTEFLDAELRETYVVCVQVASQMQLRNELVYLYDFVQPLLQARP